MNDIVLYRTHYFNDRVNKNLKHLKKSKKQIEVLFDNTDKANIEGAFNVGYDDYVDSGLKLASLKQIYKCFHNQINPGLFPRFSNVKRQQLWYNIGHSLILYYLANPNYDYYWNVEYDVYFKGQWDYFFDIFKRYKTDFIGVHIQEAPKNCDVGYWNLFDFEVPYKKRLRCFGPINRISNRLMKAVYDELIKGNHTYYEQLFPSVAKHYKYSVKDFNEISRRVIKEDVYTPLTMMYKDITLDKLVHTANSENKLFHPLR